MASGTGSVPSLEAGRGAGADAEPPGGPHGGLQLATRTRRTSPRFELWRHDPRETREPWFHLVDPDDQDPTPEGS